MKKSPVPAPLIDEPNVCGICRAPATVELLHRDKETREDLWWDSACGDKHLTKLRGRVHERPGFVWHTRKVKGAKVEKRALGSKTKKRRRR